MSAEIADVVFPIMTKTRKPYTLTTTVTTLVLKKTKDNILSLTTLLKNVVVYYNGENEI